MPIGDADLPAPYSASSAPRGLDAKEAGVKARVFQGGYYVDLHRMLGVQSGAEVRPPSPHESSQNIEVPLLGSHCLLCAAQG